MPPTVRQRVAVLLAAAALCALPAPAAANAAAADGGPSWLFSVGARWASVTGHPPTNQWVATVGGVPRTALAFTDRPHRLSVTVPLERLLKNYTGHPSGPPNAVLAYLDRHGQHRQATVTLLEASLVAWAGGARSTCTVRLTFAGVPTRDLATNRTELTAAALGCTAPRGGGLVGCELPSPWLFIDNVSTGAGTGCAPCTYNSDVRLCKGGLAPRRGRALALLAVPASHRDLPLPAACNRACPQCAAGYCCTTSGKGNQVGTPGTAACACVLLPVCSCQWRAPCQTS